MTEPTAHASASRASHPGRALAAICTAAFLAPFMGSALNLALPEISASLSLNAVDLTWLTIAYLIPTAIFQIPAARMGDLLGRRRVFLWGVLGFSVCTFASGFATSGLALIALRFLAGMCCAMMFGTNIAILTSVFPPHERGRVLGINTAMVYSSLAAGPFIGGLLTHYFGWQGIFFVCGAVGFAVTVFARVYLGDEWTVAKGERFDYAGGVLYGLGITGLICGFTRLSHPDGVAWLLAGAAALLIFIYYERRCESPIINLKLFSENRVFAFSTLATLINYAATSAIAFMLSLYLQYIKGMDARHAGLILISQACVMAVFALVSGRLSDRFSASRIATCGMAVIVGGLVIMLFLSPSTPVPLIVAGLLLLGVGFGLFSSPNTNVIMGSVDGKHYGQASAATGTMRLTGQAFSMGIAGMAISMKIGKRQITPEVFPQFMQSLRITFIIFVILCVIGVYASSVRAKNNNK